MRTRLDRLGGIYIITSPSGKKYIGSAKNFYNRWKAHRSNLRAGHHHSPPLQRAYNKYGPANLSYKILLICAEEDLIMYEQIFLDGYQPEYNIAKIAGHPTLGRKASAETRAKQSAATKGRPLRPEHSAAIAAAWTPERRLAQAERSRKMQLSPESRARAAAKRRGTKHSEETCKKLKESWATRRKNEKAFQETRRKTSESLKKHFSANPAPPRSEETKKKISLSWTPEKRAKNGLRRRGQPRTLEDKIKIWERRWGVLGYKNPFIKED